MIKFKKIKDCTWHSCWQILSDNKIIGSFALFGRSDILEIGIGIDEPRFINCGIGNRIIIYITKKFGKENILIVKTGINNISCQILMEKAKLLGFKKIKEDKGIIEYIREKS